MVRKRDLQNFIREGLDKRVCWGTARLAVHKEYQQQSIWQHMFGMTYSRSLIYLVLGTYAHPIMNEFIQCIVYSAYCINSRLILNERSLYLIYNCGTLHIGDPC